MCLQVRFVDETDPENFVKAMDDKTRAFFCETVSNPACVVTDLEKIATLAHANGVPLVVDATFSTPYLTKPISYGADVVVPSWYDSGVRLCVAAGSAGHKFKP